jgi:hypothetical protein
MIISRDRYLGDTTAYHATLAFQTRTRELHSALSDAPDAVRDQVADILTDALDRIAAVLAPVVSPRRSKSGTARVGCGA